MWNDDFRNFQFQVDMMMMDLDNSFSGPVVKNDNKKRDNSGKTLDFEVKNTEDIQKVDKNGQVSVNETEYADKTADNAVNPRENNIGDGLSPRVVSFASGSRANCTLVDSGSTRILIDFGLSCRMLSGFLKDYGLTIGDIDAVFITHEHADHVSGLPTFFKKYDIPVHMTEPSFLAYTRGKGFEYRDKITVHPVEFEINIGGFTVSSCEVCHDSAACVSYLVKGDGVSFCTCTDLGYMPKRVLEHVSRAENVILESNHDVGLLESGEYPPELKRRIRSRYGHLSNDQCAEILIELYCRGVKRVLLGHISPENNKPEIALDAVNRALSQAGVIFDYLDTAPRITPKKLI